MEEQEPRMTELRPELPSLPRRIANLPVSDRGYPVPWFVQWVDENGEPTPPGVGIPDFRIMRRDAFAMAIEHKRCWVCGGKLGQFMAFTAGPMCGINRTSSEPPSHRDCAVFSAIACPFLTRPHAKRRVGSEEDLGEMAGDGLLRNPGVAMVWVTRGYRVLDDGKGGLLIEMGQAEEVEWYAEGRKARRDEIVESIESGLPALEEVCQNDAEREDLKRVKDAFLADRVPA